MLVTGILAMTEREPAGPMILRLLKALLWRYNTCLCLMSRDPVLTVVGNEGGGKLLSNACNAGQCVLALEPLASPNSPQQSSGELKFNE